MCYDNVYAANRFKYDMVREPFVCVFKCDQSTESTETRGYELVHGTSPSYIIVGLKLASGL